MIAATLSMSGSQIMLDVAQDPFMANAYGSR
jgi:hypothetical protein